MMFRRSTLVMAISMLSLTSTNAWLSSPAPKSISTSMFSSSVDSDVKAGAEVTLSEEYKAVVDGAGQKLAAALGEESPLLPPLKHFVKEYVGSAQAAAESAIANGEEVDEKLYSPIAAVSRIMEGIQLGQKFGMPNSPDKYSFGVSHVALKGDPEKEDGNTFDYYSFGNNFFKPCMNLEKSMVLGQDNLKEAMEQIKKGENVVFLANHQSEADPQVATCMLEKAGYADEAATMIYVAGHKVTTDPLAIPFSMGRNLICIHSKKHIDSDPDLKSAKSKQNLQAMNAMLGSLKEGGCLLWVAPSGGRDRRNVETGEVPIAPFDQKTIDMFRIMGRKSKVPTHFYTMAMVSYDLCPPPDYIAAGVGEERNVRYVPVGISIGEELNAACENAEDICQKDYELLMKELGM